VTRERCGAGSNVGTNTGVVHLWQPLGFTILATLPRAFNHAKIAMATTTARVIPLDRGLTRGLRPPR
jgi:hypothetical protein